MWIAGCWARNESEGIVARFFNADLSVLVVSRPDKLGRGIMKGRCDANGETALRSAGRCGK